MVLGDHGRRILAPATPIQQAVAFPWKRFYNHSLYFRMLCRCGVATIAAWTYVHMKGYDVWFSPYSAVHHSIGHSYVHTLDHKRYPIEHHHHEENKKH